MKNIHTLIWVAVFGIGTIAGIILNQSLAAGIAGLACGSSFATFEIQNKKDE